MGKSMFFDGNTIFETKDNGDIQINMVSGSYSVVNDIRAFLNAKAGDYAFDRTLGVPYVQVLESRYNSQAYMQDTIKRELVDAGFNIDPFSFKSIVNQVTRKMTLTFTLLQDNINSQQLNFDISI